MDRDGEWRASPFPRRAMAQPWFPGPFLTFVTPPGNGPASAWIAGSGPETMKERGNPDLYLSHYYRHLPIPFAPHNATRFTKVIKYYLMIFVRRI
ncbi:hypothetical protein, partial [Roseibium sp.]|uniref:hypothetical protein n=1 Tax=Roseibium sp. TaxID=1936156 RepID=UPI00351116AC